MYDQVCSSHLPRFKHASRIALALLLVCLLGGSFFARHWLSNLVAIVNNDGFRRGAGAQENRYRLAHQLGGALSKYIANHGGMLPLMQTTSQAEKSLSPYMTDRNIFISPFTKRPWLTNATLSGANVHQLSHPQLRVAFYETAPTASNQVSRVVVVFADGSVGTISKYNWLYFQRLSHLK